MKTLTIGRGDGCDIFIDDYRISRRHALLKIHTFGKMEIVDMSKNGTWVNGVKLRSGVPFPIKRKDVVNFADVTLLNWNTVSNPMRYFRIVGIITGIAIIAILAIVMIANALSETSLKNEETVNENPASTEQHSSGNLNTDSARVASQLGSRQENTTKKEKPVNEGKKTLKELFPEKPIVKKEEPKTKEGKKTIQENNSEKKTKNEDNGKSKSKPYEIL